MNALPGTTSRRRIYLMRHGHVDYLAKHVVDSGAIHAVALTPRGKLQAEAAGKALSHVVFERAVCSGLPRTLETAEGVLSQNPRAPRLEIDSDLVEIQGGTMPKVKSREELIAIMDNSFARAHEHGAANFERGEIFASAQTRSVGAVERLLRAPDWCTALVVAHEGINRLLLSWASGSGLSAMSAFEQDTGCINIVDFDTKDGGGIGRIRIKAVNLTPYNWLKHGMNMTSLEAIFERDATEELR
ncbi:MAG TPA: histidine phosphatase family protein [Rhizomicrobium sp.]|nr:histidine phosphatase family protein [Rhizomicrobium sp.]